MADRITTTQHTLDGGQVTRTRFKFGPSEYDRLRAVAEGHRMECEFHYSHLNPTVPAVLYIRPDRTFYAGPPMFKAPYFDPWQGKNEEPQYSDTICRFCDDYGLQQGYDFGPQWCERCGRDVVQRCPQNGWRSYFGSDPEDPEEMCCVGCSQRFYMEHGIPRERFEDNDPITCDFFNYDEVTDAGFSEGETYSGREIADDPDTFRTAMLDLIDAGNAVLLDQGATGIGNGYPDTVTVYFKPIS